MLALECPDRGMGLIRKCLIMFWSVMLCLAHLFVPSKKRIQRDCNTVQQSVPLLPIPVSSSPRADPKLTKLIAVAGIVAEPDDFVNFWKGLGDKEAERFTLVWETKELIALKNSMVNMILSQVRPLSFLYFYTSGG